jgi:hypothetical protein
MKLNQDNPGQHKALLIVAGCMIFLSLLDSIRGGDDTSSKSKKVAVASAGPRYRNPQLSWYEKVFCRGYQRSLSCGFKFYHPMKRQLQAEGKRIKEKPAPNGVVLYRGRLGGVEDNWEANQRIR